VLLELAVVLLAAWFVWLIVVQRLATNVNLKASGVEISGTVKMAEGGSLPLASLLILSPIQRNGKMSLTRIDVDGSFKIGSIESGQYEVSVGTFGYLRFYSCRSPYR
jgi:hypothetical protein